jgi:hypothetical protein
VKDSTDPADARMILHAGRPARLRRPAASSEAADDDTIRMKRPANAARRRRVGWIGGSALGLVLVVLLAWGLWPGGQPGSHPSPAPHALPSSQPATAVAPGPAAAPAFTIRTATRREILAAAPTGLDVFRYAANPNIVVLDFATLHAQGLMLDRVAALVEKAGLPRDQVVSWTALRARIRAHGDTIGTYYYGHDYSAAALARFFALARQNHRSLDPQEQRLYALLEQLGWLRPGVSGGLITLPRVGANRYVTPGALDVILTHELSHGEFFSNPAYAAYVYHFWDTALTPAQRAGIRRFLGSEEYDTTDRELMVNEMQAYLMFTRNPEFFRAADIGMTPQERRRLQDLFLAGMPSGWLRDRLADLNAGR